MLSDISPVSIALFLGVIVLFIWIDLHTTKKGEPVSLKKAILWSSIWVSVSMAFAGYVGVTYGFEKTSLFLAGYLLELSLSVDNLFVFMAVFSSFAVKSADQHRVLYYGIIGALIMRFIFIALGTSLLLLGQWVLGLFGIFVLWTAWEMWKSMKKDEEEIEDYTHHWSVNLVKRFLPVHPRMEKDHFFTRQPDPEKSDGSLRLMVTPMFLCLICVEMADVMFAFDSVPAIIAITQEPFLIYTSNIFAILGLRSMYFVLEAAKRYLCHLEKAVIVILIFIGIKMLLMTFTDIHLPAMVSLGVVFSALMVGIVGSFIFPEKEEEDPPSDTPQKAESA
ncbi:MAG: TerC family protein [Magnetococcales bacterium]|nr:TerC family protein [Magnetococcales bacterium]